MDLSYLQSRVSSSRSFPPHRTQLHPRMHSSSPSTHSRAARILLIAPSLFLLFLFFLFHRARFPPKAFSVIIDAGASASRVHIFEFLDVGGMPLVGIDGKGSVSMSARPGLREFAAEPESAGGVIRVLLEFARTRVPREAWGETEVRLIENEGLRGLGMDLRRGILESCCREIRASGFSFREDWVFSITGLFGCV